MALETSSSGPAACLAARCRQRGQHAGGLGRVPGPALVADEAFWAVTAAAVLPGVWAWPAAVCLAGGTGLASWGRLLGCRAVWAMASADWSLGHLVAHRPAWGCVRGSGPWGHSLLCFCGVGPWLFQQPRGCLGPAAAGGLRNHSLITPDRAERSGPLSCAAVVLRLACLVLNGRFTVPCPLLPGLMGAGC